MVYSLNQVFTGNIFWLTSFLFNPSFFLKHWSFIQQRRNDLLVKNQIIFPWYWFLREGLLRLFFKGEGRNFIRDRLHDFWVSKWVSKCQPHLVMGSEKSCKNTFLAVKKYKGICVLDLAQIHVCSLAEIRKKHAFLRKEWGNNFLFKEIQKVKLLEYELADFIFVISTIMKESLLFAGIPPHKIFSVTLGFNPSVFHQNYPKLSTDSQRLNLIFVGNISVAKGIFFLIKVMDKLLHFPVFLTLIGSNSKSFKRNNLPSNISFLGIMDEQNVADHLRNADVLVFPSYLDSWGRVVVEAMACGLPVIISDTVGAAELVDDEVGFVLPIDEDRWISAILFLLFNPFQRMEMGIHAASKIEPFSWEKYQNEVNNHIVNIINMNKYGR